MIGAPPARSGVRPHHPRARRWLKWLARLVLAFIAVTWLPVLILRFVPPVTSAYMIERSLSQAWHGHRDFEVHYHWVPWVKIEVAMAMPCLRQAAFDHVGAGDGRHEAQDQHRQPGYRDERQHQPREPLQPAACARVVRSHAGAGGRCADHAGASGTARPTHVSNGC